MKCGRLPLTKTGAEEERKTRVGSKVESESGRTAHRNVEAGPTLALRL